MNYDEIPVIETDKTFGSQDGLLYRGDMGELELEARRVLIKLLSGPYLDGRRNNLLWPALVKNETIIRKRLGDLFLELVVDEDQRVAFIRQAQTDRDDTPTLLRQTTLTFIDSVVLLYLRQQLLHAESHGERTVVSIEEIQNEMQSIKAARTSDHALFDKRITGAVEKLKERGILQTIKGSEDRFEVSPTLKLLFSATEVATLITEYKRILEHGDSEADE
jgi:hypothetical protein